MTDTPPLAVGLRFTTRDAKLLEQLADRAASLDLQAAYDLLHNAHTAAQRDEPLLLFCADHNEALDYAERFHRWGTTRPTIEQLNGLTY